MTFGPVRMHISYLFERFARDLFMLLLAAFFAVLLRTWEGAEHYLWILLLAAVGPLFRLIRFLTTRILFENEELIIREGWIGRSRQTIPASSVTTVNLSQNLSHRIFGSYRMTIDNAGTIGGAREISLTLSASNAQTLKELLTQKSGGTDGANLLSRALREEEAGGRMYRPSAARILLFGAMRSKGTAITAILALMSAGGGFLYPAVDRLTEGRLTRWGEGAVVLLRDTWDGRIPWRTLLLTGLLWLLLLFLLAMLLGALRAILTYYDLQLSDTGGMLYIRYGLLTKKEYKLDKSRICGFCYEQSFLMRLFGYGTLDCIAIGYGKSEEKNASEDPMVMPFIEEAAAMEMMREILPALRNESEAIRPSGKHAYYFTYSYSFAFFLLLSVGLAVAGHRVDPSFYAAGVLALFLGLMQAYLQYRHASLAGDERGFVLSCGGFKKRSYYLRTDQIENMRDMTSRFKKQKGITSVTVGYLAKHGQVTVHNLEAERARALYELLRY